MKALTIVTTSLRQTYSRPINIFFLVILPLAIVMLLGGNQEGSVGVYAPTTPTAKSLARDIARIDLVKVVRYDSPHEVVRAVERGNVQGGLVIPASFDKDLEGAEAVKLRYYARPDSMGQQVRIAVASKVQRAGARLTAGRFLLTQGTSSGLDDALRRVDKTAPFVRTVDVEVHSSGRKSASGFTIAASTQLTLFIFLSTLSAAYALVEARRAGIVQRIMSTPTSLRTVIVGNAIARYLAGIVQALIIVVGVKVLFDVSFGNPLAVAAVVAAFTLVATAFSLLLGALCTTEQQVSALSLLLALVLAAIGGSMAPLDVFSPTMRRIAHLTPHGWANDAMGRIVNDGALLGDVARQLAVLVVMGLVAMALSVHMLRRSVVR